MLNKLIEQHMAVFSNLGPLADSVGKAAGIVTTALMSNRKIMLCGNGGSASDSQHIAAEFIGRFVKDRRPLAAMALSTDSSSTTCVGNDYSFADIFVRQVDGLGRPGDVLVAISTSGNSENVIRAVESARRNSIHTVALLGRGGGRLGQLVDLPIVIPSDITARIQEAHIFIGHVLCAMVEKELGLD